MRIGTTVGITDSAGALVSSQKYWPYGAMRSATKQPPPLGITQTDKLYTGQQIENGDASLGLYNYKARFYSTTLGRFLSVDPVGGSEGDPQSWNPYAYVRNNPLVYVDPTGMYWGEGFVKKAKELVTGATKGAFEAVTSTPGAAWDAARGGLDMGVDAARNCWANEVCQSAAIGGGVLGCSALTGQPFACGMAGAALASLDNASPCAHGSAGDCGAIGVEFGAVALGAAAPRVAPAVGRYLGTVRWADETGALGFSSARLGRNLERAGFQRYAGEEAHHIVAGGARKAAPAQRALARFGIDIDSAENGVFLPKRVHQSLTRRQAYYDAVNDLVGSARTRMDALAALRDIRRGLLESYEP